MKLQQVVKDKERLLEECYIRMEMGEAPSTELEQEWQKIQRNEIQRTRDKQVALQVNSLKDSCTTPWYKNVVVMIIL